MHMSENREPRFRSMTHHVEELGRRIVVLRRNWRSHGAIIAWSNRYLYEDVMRDYGNSYITYNLVRSDVLPKKGFPVMFHGVKSSVQRTKWSPSSFNVLEASVIRNYCMRLIGDSERKICECGIFVVPRPCDFNCV